MNLPRYRLSAQQFADLAAGGGGREAVTALAAAEYCKHVILLDGVLTAVRDSPLHGDAREGYDLLAEAWRVNPLEAERVIAYPAVGVWARRTILAIRGGVPDQAPDPGDLRTIGATAAIRAGLHAEIDVPVRAGRVVLPSLGAATIANSSQRFVTVRVKPTGTRIGSVAVPPGSTDDGPGWLALSRVSVGSLRVVIDDLHPFRMPGTTDLSPPTTDPSTWKRALRDAWRVLETDHPEAAAEVAASISVIVPRSSESGRAVSSTSPEAFGAVAMSLPHDPVTGAESLVHEVQHLKLGAMLDIVRLTLPDDGRRYYAPWRDDPRPLGALLQGTYAFLGVAGFWRRQRRLAGHTSTADRMFVRRLYGVTMAVETLRSSGSLSSEGLAFVGQMERTLASWEDDSVPTAERILAWRLAQDHRERWESEYGSVPTSRRDQMGIGSKSKSSRFPAAATTVSG
jgi:uncharacterized protein